MVVSKGKDCGISSENYYVSQLENWQIYKEKCHNLRSGTVIKYFTISFSEVQKIVVSINDLSATTIFKVSVYACPWKETINEMIIPGSSSFFLSIYNLPLHRTSTSTVIN